VPEPRVILAFDKGSLQARVLEPDVHPLKYSTFSPFGCKNENRGASRNLAGRHWIDHVKIR
jgi:hypothetical protein